jgi:hypothetical protein
MSTRERSTLGKEGRRSMGPMEIVHGELRERELKSGEGSGQRDRNTRRKLQEGYGSCLAMLE